tara:strand:+ start:296 stop:1030 length:735 start_codon:yes stop_codon:yes gene_type:complete
MEPPGVKKYSNENIFLNSMNDLTRSAYSNNTKANDLDNKPINRFDTDILLNSKESFDSNNQKLNSLQEEILSLKRKLSIIPEKDEEIQSLKCEIEKLNDQNDINSALSSEVNKLKLDNQGLRDNYDRLQLENMNNQKLQQENNMLKRKIIDLNKKIKSEKNEEEFSDSEIADIMTEDYEEDKLEINDTEKIQINVPQLKQILSNRLKSYHEKHIDNLINLYNLKGKESIEKETMEKLLLEAIHI